MPTPPHACWLHVALTVAFAWISAGVLRDLLSTRDDERLISPRAGAPRIGATEVTVALGAIDLLFLVFVLVQVRYLFGDAPWSSRGSA